MAAMVIPYGLTMDDHGTYSMYDPWSCGRYTIYNIYIHILCIDTLDILIYYHIFLVAMNCCSALRCT